MRKYIYLALTFILIAGIIFILGSRIKPLKKLCVNNFCINAEIAANEKARHRGLMFRRSIPQDRGMLFIFKKEALYSFWMKNTRFPLDIIWIDSGKNIVSIYEYALPCKDFCKTITPQANAQFVLEVNAGFVRAHGIKIGDKLDF